MNEREHPDLFWALRGGGGNFGIATAFELTLHPVGPIVFGGPLVWPAADAGRILAAYAELCRDAPDELSLFAACSRVPWTCNRWSRSSPVGSVRWTRPIGRSPRCGRSGPHST